jgi:hypothetical protein
MKSEFKLFERVQLANLPSTNELHNKTGFICGKSMSNTDVDFYIVYLDVPTDTHLAVSVTELCIESEPVISGGSAAYIG